MKKKFTARSYKLSAISLQLSVLILTVGSWRLANAQQSDTLRKEIPEVTVTATRIPEDPNKVGRSVTVISQDEMKKLQPNDLGQLLSMQQGISVTGDGQNPGLTQTLFMRGTNSNHTLVMIDGVRITDPSSVNDALDLVEIPNSGFDQIEIVRGSHSTLYGSSCIGGVINLITSGKQSPGFHGDVSLLAGNFGAKTGLLEENLELNYSCKSGLYVNFNIYNINTKGLDETVDTVTNPNAFKSFDQDNLNLFKSSGKIGFENSRWNLFATYGAMSQHTDYDKAGYKYNNPFGPNPLAYYDGDSTTLTAFRNLITYHAEYFFSQKFSLLLAGGFTSLSRKSVDDSSIVDLAGTYDHTFDSEDYSGTEMNHDLQATWRNSNVSVIAGAGFLRETMTQQTSFYTNSGFGPFISETNLDSLDLHSIIYHGYAQAEISGGIINKKLSTLELIAGLRYNHHDLFGDAVNYEINPSYHLTKDALLYASFSSGFNAPSLYQLYSPSLYYTSDITIGNPTLQPEVSHSAEFGFKQKVSENFQINVALYQNVVKNEIEYVYLWDKNVPIDSLGTNFNRDDYRGDTYLNVGTLTSRGVEVSFDSKLNRHFEISGNANLVSGKLSYDPSQIDTTHTQGNHIQLYSNGAFPTSKVETIGLTRRPITANLFFTYSPIQKLSLQLITRYIGPHTDIYYDSNLGPFGALNTVALEDYVLLDVLADFEFTENFSASFKVENIFNTNYTDLRGFTSRGRGFYMTLRGKFQ